MILVAVALLELALLQLVFGGSVREDRSGLGIDVPLSVVEVDHGWPMLAVSRSVVNEATHRNAIWQGRHRMDGAGLAVDAAVFVAVTTVLGCGLYRTWQRGIRPAFSLRTVVLAVTVIAVICADAGRQAARCEAARKAGAELEQLGVRIDSGYAGTVWLERLFGDWAYRLALFIAPTTISLGQDVASMAEIVPLAAQ